MPISDSVKIARINERAALRADLVKLLSHPLYSSLFFLVAVESLQAVKVNGQPLVGSVAGTAAEAAMMISMVAQSGLFDTAAEGLKSLAALAPALLAKNPAGLTALLPMMAGGK